MHVWAELWPNLAANVLWAPLVWIHHRVMARNIRALREHVTALHRQHEELLVQHLLGGAADTQQNTADERLTTKGL